MDIAVTLVIQGLVFFISAWVVMKFLWPNIITAIETRQKKIAEGLAAANRSQKDLDEAQARAKEILREARDKAAQLVEQAGMRQEVGRLAIAGASQLLGREIDARTHAELLDKLSAEIARG